jgi:prophage regulatory protein
MNHRFRSRRRNNLFADPAYSECILSHVEWLGLLECTSREVHHHEVTDPVLQEAEMEDRALDKPGPRRMLNEKQVLAITPVSRTTLYRMEKTGRFPRSTNISPNRRVWFEDEITAWQNAVDEFNPNRGRGKGRRARASS